ncbi:MAG: single-stranded-DNA-specific exonuclease RecJ [Acidobacteria bacterium]|nr:single-stranded-DNA-specific exonuclease RecJ [Acidobacteriota bacterium]
MRWLAKPFDDDQVHLLAQALKAQTLALPHALMARLLLNRRVFDVDSAQRFLVPSLSQLHSPYRMKDMKAAVQRLQAAIAAKEKILIYGDYDVDGTTAIVVLKTAVELCGGSVEFYVPHRIREGYGMNDQVIEEAARSGVRLIISVDTGIRAFAAAATARRLGIDLIVTDHHLPGPGGVPAALAVLNPNQPGCDYPCKVLCGCGVAFKLAQALMEKLLNRTTPSRLLISFMKVVAIATIADAVPLRDENRVFTRLGLQGLRTPVNPGLKALLEIAELMPGRGLNSGEVAFRIAPRLNAAGRMDVAHDVVELFSVKDATRARQIAARLDQLNGERQQEERRILEEVASRCEKEPGFAEAFCMVVEGEGWHRGVIGIAASRVVERYRRPALVISRDGEEAHGSGRSIRSFHLLEALESCATLLDRYGGHAHAVGFALPASRVPELRARLDEFARSRLTAKDFEPMLEVDAELALHQVTPELVEALGLLAPFGMDNPQPVFATRAVRLLEPPRIVKDRHLKLKLGSTARRDAPDGRFSWRQSVAYQATAWRMAERAVAEQLVSGDVLDIAYTVGQNEHPDFGGLELTLCDFERQANAPTPAPRSRAESA